MITSQYYKQLAKAYHENGLIDYIVKRTKWSWHIYNLVDWDAHGRAFSKLTKYQQIHMAKLLHNLANTKWQNFLYYKSSALCQGWQNFLNYRSSALCPGCKAEEEIFQHVLTGSLQSIVIISAPHSFSHWLPHWDRSTHRALLLIIYSMAFKSGQNHCHKQLGRSLLALFVAQIYC